MVNDFYYNKGKLITREEAHALTDKSGLVVADREVNFKTEVFKGTKMGLAEDYDAENEVTI
jgi:hypothetical protein